MPKSDNFGSGSKSPGGWGGGGSSGGGSKGGGGSGKGGGGSGNGGGFSGNWKGASPTPMQAKAAASAKPATKMKSSVSVKPVSKAVMPAKSTVAAPKPKINSATVAPKPKPKPNSGASYKYNTKLKPGMSYGNYQSGAALSSKLNAPSRTAKSAGGMTTVYPGNNSGPDGKTVKKF